LNILPTEVWQYVHSTNLDFRYMDGRLLYCSTVHRWDNIPTCVYWVYTPAV